MVTVFPLAASPKNQVHLDHHGVVLVISDEKHNLLKNKHIFFLLPH